MFMRNKTSAGAYDFMIVGLGNPGKQYEMTRHNVGFLCLGQLCTEEGTRIHKLKFHALVGEAVLCGKRCLLMKPNTFMNNSGEAVKAAADFYHIAPEHILVIYDDISLPVGRLRIRRKGTHGGHNGMRSITDHLGTQEIPRIKLGVGNKPHPDYDLADWVLSGFKAQEHAPLREALEHACAAIRLMVDGRVEEAMNQYNS